MGVDWPGNPGPCAPFASITVHAVGLVGANPSPLTKRSLPRPKGRMSNPLPLSLSTATGASPVRSFNEWDPLEEVIVGSLDGAVMPPSHITVTRTIPPLAAQLYRLFGGHRYPR